MSRTFLDAVGCQEPPPGWECTRGRDHDGPCAAYPVNNTQPGLLAALWMALVEFFAAVQKALGL